MTSRRQFFAAAGSALALPFGLRMGWRPAAPTVLVIGGGLAGLTAIQSATARGLNARLLEASTTVGGQAQSRMDLPRLSDVYLAERALDIHADDRGVAVVTNQQTIRVDGVIVAVPPNDLAESGLCDRVLTASARHAVDRIASIPCPWLTGEDERPTRHDVEHLRTLKGRVRLAGANLSHSRFATFGAAVTTGHEAAEDLGRWLSKTPA